MILKIFTIFVFVLQLASAVIVLQLPGIAYGNGGSNSIDVEFQDIVGAPVYLVKGDIFDKNIPTTPNSLFVPERLLNNKPAIKSIRIKAGESGMVLKLYGGMDDTVPRVTIMMKQGFNDASNPIVVDMLTGDDNESNGAFQVNWVSRDNFKNTLKGGLAIGKIEVQVVRSQTQQQESPQSSANPSTPRPQQSYQWSPQYR